MEDNYALKRITQNNQKTLNGGWMDGLDWTDGWIGLIGGYLTERWASYVCVWVRRFSGRTDGRTHSQSGYNMVLPSE